MDNEPCSGGTPVEQLLRHQGRAARSRDRLRRTASVAAWPMAICGGLLISTYGTRSDVNAFVSWLLLMISGVFLLATFGWRAARMLSSRIPPWTSSRRVARAGVWAAVGVASIAAVLVAPAAALAAMLFWAVVVFAVVMLRLRERQLDGQVERLGHEVMMLVGYR